MLVQETFLHALPYLYLARGENNYFISLFVILNYKCHLRATYAMPNFFHHTLLLHIPSIHYHPQLELCISSIGYVHPPSLFVTYPRLHPLVPVLICINSAVEIYLGHEKYFYQQLKSINLAESFTAPDKTCSCMSLH